jgi:hypothetical protein
MSGIGTRIIRERRPSHRKRKRNHAQPDFVLIESAIVPLARDSQACLDGFADPSSS